MATPLSHALLAGTLALGIAPRQAPIKLWILGALCAAIPDLDAIGFWMGVPYDHPFGHRGFTHSLAFAALLSGAVVFVWFRGAEWRPVRWTLLGYFFLATASHGFLDAMTNGGLGIAFFAPFDQTRYFFPFRPIQVSPITISGFFREGGAAVLMSELVWVGVPCVVVILILVVFARMRRGAVL